MIGSGDTSRKNLKVPLNSNEESNDNPTSELMIISTEKKVEVLEEIQKRADLTRNSIIVDQ
jgi:hypothetical protein